MRIARFGLVIAVAACGGNSAARDAGDPDRDATVDAAPCSALPTAPTAPLRPVAGELFYAQLGLGGLSIGEAAVLVGTDGAVVLIDVGNDSHGDDVVAAVTALTGRAHTRDVVITHFHADHGDGLERVLADLTVTGTIVHRGFTDLTPAANAATIERACTAIAAGAQDRALCSAAGVAPCAAASWVGTYPATACTGLGSTLALGGDAALTFVAANGRIAGEDFATTIGPIRTDDSNGENARSVVAVVSRGPFRMLLGGDLTGGGSSTDDLESFYAARLDIVDALGVDVLHLGHHGRNTSSNSAWVDRLLPADGADRNAIMGISTAHLNSPHQVVVDTVLGAGRLAAGRLWTTRIAANGGGASGLVNAGGGEIRIATLAGGDAYAIQAIDGAGAVIESRVYRTLRGCR